METRHAPSASRTARHAMLVVLAGLLLVTCLSYVAFPSARPTLLAFEPLGLWAIALAGAAYGGLGGFVGGGAATLVMLALERPVAAPPRGVGGGQPIALAEHAALLTAVAGLVGYLGEFATTAGQAVTRAERSERRFRTITETVSDVVAIFDRDGCLTYASRSHATLLGREPASLTGHSASFAYGADEIDDHLAAAIRAGTRTSRLEMRARHADGTLRVIDVVLRYGFDDETIDGIVLSGRDITERKAVEEDLSRQARFDPLTGLPNRRHLREQLDVELTAARIGKRALAVLFIDLDGFKYVNDVLGHEWGDTLLESVATRLRGRMRDNDVVARLGGDEFAVVLPGLAADEARVVAQRLSAALTVPYTLAERSIVVGASIGIAVAAPDSDARSLLRQADIAMYGAKRRRSGVRLFTREDDEQVTNRLMTASSLHQAIADDRLVLHFQPQLAIATSQVVGVEALLRWQHPDRGLLAPDAFIPTAEELGMMGRVTEWVLRAALKQLARWRERGCTLRLAVNLSAQDLREAKLAETILRLVEAYDIPPDSLCLELTETAVAADMDRSIAFLTAVAKAGVRISIDDYGTGYSSLAHLRRFPVDELKIDKTFVIGMEEDDDDRLIVSSTIDLAHRLGISVVVEGVERRSTLHAVAALGADIAQGYSIGAAMPITEFDRWYLERQGGEALV